ncbi:Aldehyde reductase [Paramyrothecium foliicola]|nr:Aldehyde reductase [Paramyrothecium foliicola]
MQPFSVDFKGYARIRPCEIQRAENVPRGQMHLSGCRDMRPPRWGAVSTLQVEVELRNGRGVMGAFRRCQSLNKQRVPLRRIDIMPSTSDPSIPQGAVVLVTGVNGFIGSIIADYFLQNGYKVRGAVRNPTKAAWLQAHFDKQYPGNFKLFEVPVITLDGAYNEAVKGGPFSPLTNLQLLIRTIIGTSAFIHVASDVSFNCDPNKVIPLAINGAVNALKSAFAEPSVKRFVLTSSSTAVAPIPTPGAPKKITVDVDTWNEAAVKAAWAPPPYEPERGGAVYSASKMQAEQGVWKYYKENKEKRPDLVVNTVLPNMNFGKVLDPVNQGYPSSAGIIQALFEGNVGKHHHAAGHQDYINVVDTAALHYAAAILPNVQDERIFGFAGHYTWPRILEIMRKNFPDKTFPEDFEGLDVVYDVRPRARAEQLLREVGRPGFTSLEDSILANISNRAKI